MNGIKILDVTLANCLQNGPKQEGFSLYTNEFGNKL